MSNIKLVESKQIRSIWNEDDEKWYFSVADVVEALTDSVNVRDYIKKMRKREQEFNANCGTLCPPFDLAEGNERVTSCNVLKMIAQDGKQLGATNETSSANPV